MKCHHSFCLNWSRTTHWTVVCLSGLRESLMPLVFSFFCTSLAYRVVTRVIVIRYTFGTWSFPIHSQLTIFPMFLERCSTFAVLKPATWRNGVAFYITWANRYWKCEIFKIKIYEYNNFINFSEVPQSYKYAGDSETKISWPRNNSSNCYCQKTTRMWRNSR